MSTAMQSLSNRTEDEQPQSETYSRRRVLRSGAALAGAVTTGSLAGCLGSSEGERPTPVGYPLDRDDPRVRDARSAERRAYEHYGLEFDEHFIDVEPLGGRFRVLEIGTGPPVVLVPGGVGYGVQWLPLLPELSEYTVYVVDRPGGGLSDGVDHQALPLQTFAETSIAALYDHFAFDSVPLIGNSMGGYWSLRFALGYPDRAAGIALLGCPALFPGETVPISMMMTALPLVGGVIIDQMLQPDDVTDARDGLASLGHPESTRQHLPTELFAAIYRMENVPHFARSWMSLSQSAGMPPEGFPDPALTTEDLRDVLAPVLFLWGTNDPYGSLDVGRAGAEVVPDVAFFEAGVGHLPWLDDPSTCGELIREFLG
jgi:pimeloyl-ACP methyl ester carboxylesterase